MSGALADMLPQTPGGYTVMDAVSYVFVWHFRDDRACPVCMRLNGRSWADQDIYQATIWDPIWGDVYDLNAGEPIVHPHCRCYVEVIVKIEPMKFPELQQLASVVEVGQT